jgi:hypothetical protein
MMPEFVFSLKEITRSLVDVSLQKEAKELAHHVEENFLPCESLDRSVLSVINRARKLIFCRRISDGVLPLRSLPIMQITCMVFFLPSFHFLDEQK